MTSFHVPTPAHQSDLLHTVDDLTALGFTLFYFVQHTLGHSDSLNGAGVFDTETKAWVPMSGSCSSAGQPKAGSEHFEMELWVLIVEKALVKLQGGGYGAMALGGRTEDALNYLTGGLVSRIDVRTRLDCWGQLISASTQTSATTWSLPPTTCLTCTLNCSSTAPSEVAKTQRAQERGLIPGRVYRLCQVVELPKSGGERGMRQAGPPRRLIQLCDPFGVVTWKGNWRAGDRRWTPELKRFAGWSSERAARGFFFVSIEDFAEYQSD
jgi:hypothetical protein